MVSLKLKDILSKEELWNLDEELFRENYEEIMAGDWTQTSKSEVAETFKHMSEVQQMSFAIQRAGEMLKDLPNWELQQYFARYGSRYLELRRGASA